MLDSYAEKINNKITIDNLEKAKTCLGSLLLRYSKDPIEQVSAGGIIMPQKQDLFVTIAEVVSVSNMVTSSGGSMASVVSKGDRVIVEKRSGIILGEQADGFFYKVIMPKDIVLILPKEEK